MRKVNNIHVHVTHWRENDRMPALYFFFFLIWQVVSNFCVFLYPKKYIFHKFVHGCINLYKLLHKNSPEYKKYRVWHSEYSKTTSVSPSFDKICYQKISVLVLHAFNLFVLLAQLSEAFYHVITLKPVMFSRFILFKHVFVMGLKGKLLLVGLNISQL